MKCPDCDDGYLELRSGRYGLFYGCVNYRKSLCRGSVSADSQGMPLGEPVNAVVRRARYCLKVLLENVLKSPRIQSPGTPRALHLLRNPSWLYNYDLEQCKTATDELCQFYPDLVEVLRNIPDHIHRTVIERLTRHHPLDGMLWPV